MLRLSTRSSERQLIYIPRRNYVCDRNVSGIVKISKAASTRLPIKEQSSSVEENDKLQQI